VGDENQAEGSALLQLFEQFDDVGFGILVEVACRFVSEKQPRRIDQPAGDRNPPLLAAGHIAWVGIGAVGETDPGKEVIGSRICLSAVHCAAQQRRDRKGRQLVFRKRPEIRAVEQ
jgi:hypothetical protein